MPSSSDAAFPAASTKVFVDEEESKITLLIVFVVSVVVGVTCLIYDRFVEAICGPDAFRPKDIERYEVPVAKPLPGGPVALAIVSVAALLLLVARRLRFRG